MTGFSKNLSIGVKALCAAILSMLGFKAASEVYVMYGIPVGDFKIKGSVKDAENDTPVRDAQIKAKYDNEANQTVINIVRTDSNGNFTLTGQALSDRLQIICTPFDSITPLRPDTIIVTLQYRRNDSDSRPSVRYRGSAEATVNFTLMEERSF